MKAKSYLIGALMVAVSAGLSSCGLPTGERGSSPDVIFETKPLSGLEIATTRCAMCHAIGRKGASPHSDALEFRSFSKFYPIEHLGEALAEGIVVGHPDMPVFQFNPGEIDALIAYIETVQDPLEL